MLMKNVIEREMIKGKKGRRHITSLEGKGGRVRERLNAAEYGIDNNEKTYKNRIKMI